MYSNFLKCFTYIKGVNAKGELIQDGYIRFLMIEIYRMKNKVPMFVLLRTIRSLQTNQENQVLINDNQNDYKE